MEANIFNGQASKIVNKVIDKIMLASGIIGIVWILAFLLVGIIDK
jgi:hypothetical protein